MEENNFRFPDVVAEMRSYWLMGQTGGQLLNGHFGYVEIAPESTYELLVCEFIPIAVLPGFEFN